MSSRDIERVYGDPDLAWRVLGLLNVYRLLVPTALFVLAALLPSERGPGSAAPGLFGASIAGMFLAGVLCILLLKRRWPDLRLQAYLHIAFDIFAVTLLLVSSGGVASGLGLLLIMPVGAMSLLLANRSAILLAAVATLCILGQQIFFVLVGVAEAGSLTPAGILGAVIFIVALAAAPLANRLRETEAQVRQREIDLANLAELSQYVVERLREPILVVDEQDQIRLINDAARQILSPPAEAAGALLGEVSPRLLYLLATWRQNPRDDEAGRGTLLAPDGMREVRPRFAPLGERLPSPVIVFLEDLSQISARAEQSKLAALGRLSASIAHEIRNPVGAMSHAAQLLEEGEGLDAGERRLTQIIRQNADRVSTIIQNVMQLSRREEIRAERMPLAEWLGDFVTEFSTTHGLRPERVALRFAEPDLEVRIDPSHLHQILWNLCENALKYGLGTAETAFELNAGRAPATGRPFLEVADHGAGIEAAAAERIFEPFFTSAASGTGLGLFISRELAQSNGALLLYEPRQGGGSIFRLIFADPQRWEPA